MSARPQPRIRYDASASERALTKCSPQLRAEPRETREEHAEGVVAAELKRRHWTEGRLERRLKGDAGKVAMAVLLRAETEVTVRWIAERLRMGTPGYLNHLLYQRRTTKKK